jgi:hypothetical protein
METGPLLIQPDPRLKRRMDYADLLLKQGADTSPTPNWLAGAARALTGAAGGYFRSQADRQLEGRQTAANEGLMRALEAGKGWTNPDTNPDLAGQEALRVNDPSRTYLAAGERVGGGYEAVIAALEGQRNPDLAPYAHAAPHRPVRPPAEARRHAGDGGPPGAARRLPRRPAP